MSNTVMTAKEAHAILHPDTSAASIWEIKMDVSNEAAMKAVEDACVVACEALETQIPKKVNNREEHADYIEGNCPDCDLPVCDVDNYCSKCGCLLDWSE